jgi:hypothetical protein
MTTINIGGSNNDSNLVLTSPNATVTDNGNSTDLSSSNLTGILSNQDKILAEIEKLNINIDRQDLLHDIIARGFLNAGVETGFSYSGHIRIDASSIPTDSDIWLNEPIGGWDWVIPRIISFVIFNLNNDTEVENHVTYKHVNGTTRFTTIKDRSCDITSRATSKTFERAVKYDGYFLPAHIVGSMGVICDVGIIVDLELSNTEKLKIIIEHCLANGSQLSVTETGTSNNAAKNILSEYNAKNNTTILFEDVFLICANNDACFESYLNQLSGGVTVKVAGIVGDAVTLYGFKADGAAPTESIVVIDKNLTIEPLCAFIPNGNPKYYYVCSIIYNALFLADVLELTKENISSKIDTIYNLDLKNMFVDNSSLKILLGDEHKDVLKRVIQVYGNFREIFEETFGQYSSAPYVGQTIASNRVLQF